MLTSRLWIAGTGLAAILALSIESCSSGPAPGSDAGSTSDVPAVGAAPIATINHPGDGETRQVSVGVPMIGVAMDAEDGALPDAVMIWTSNVEGAIGTGRMWTWTPTMTGTQTVTLTVTDSDGQVGTDTVTLTISP